MLPTSMQQHCNRIYAAGTTVCSTPTQTFFFDSGFFVDVAPSSSASSGSSSWLMSVPVSSESQPSESSSSDSSSSLSPSSTCATENSRVCKSQLLYGMSRHLYQSAQQPTQAASALTNDAPMHNMHCAHCTAHRHCRTVRFSFILILHRRV